MPFVHVEQGRLDPQCAQQANAADSKKNFLQNKRGAVAAIDSQSQVTKMLLVVVAVGVEQINRDAAHVHTPGMKRDLAHADIDLADERLAVLIENRLDRQVAGLKQRVVLRLPVVGVDGLLE